MKHISKDVLRKQDPDRWSKWEERLSNEISAQRATVNKHVCCFKETSEDSSSVFVAMEMCSGKQLFDVVVCSPHRRLSEPQAAFLMWQLVDGVNAIHHAGYIHRDLKPENVLCCPVGGDDIRVKIVDFGAAKRLVGDAQHWLGRCSLMASVSGTLAWNVTPERGYGERESTASDMWALGCILYFMLVGKAPFCDLMHPEEDGVVLDRVQEEDVEWPEQHVSESARQLVEWLLDKEECERPSLEEVMEHEWWSEQDAQGQGREALMDLMKKMAASSSPDNNNKAEGKSQLRKIINHAIEMA